MPDTEEQIPAPHHSPAPAHYRVLNFALILTTATIVVQVMHATGGPAAEQAVITMRVACTIVWGAFFTVYAVHMVCRRFDAAQECTVRCFESIEARLNALESERRGSGASGLDSESIESARVIAHRLMRGN
jgi:hypothetical protein